MTGGKYYTHSAPTDIIGSYRLTHEVVSMPQDPDHHLKTFCGCFLHFLDCGLIISLDRRYKGEARPKGKSS